MDPVSVVGVAAAAIQFYTFTTSVAKATCRAASSSGSLHADASDLEAVSARFQETVERLDEQLKTIESQAAGLHLSDMERQLQDTCAKCLPKAKKLHTASSQLAAKMNRSGQMRKMWQILKGEFGQDDLQLLTGTLSKLQSDISSAMIACSWDSAKNTENAIASLSNQMTALFNAVVTSDQFGSSQIEASAFVQDIARHEVLRSQSMLEELNWSGFHLAPVWDELKRDFEDRSWPREPMDTTENKSRMHRRLAKDIISKLRFDKMATRHNAITKQHASTFEWIWDAEPAVLEASGEPKWSSFPAWLESSSTTPYWVTGRPGSGKSTLLRFIEDHRNLQHHLSQWKPGLRLQVLSYYAWNPGSGCQKSIEGLARTILFQLLESEPHLLPVVMPRRWAFSTAIWSTKYPQDFEVQDLEQLEEGLMCLLSTTQPDLKLMVFVDGLDEFDVAPKELIHTMESIKKHDNVKLCIASRPWIEFEDSFESWPHLRIHELSADDIDKLTRDRFQQSKAARKRPIQAEHIRAEIQKNAGGVFQWVTVVVNFTLDKLESGDPLQDILDILHRLPEELSDLYTAIWERLAPERQEQAREIFMLQLIARGITKLDYITLWCVNERHSSASSIELLKDTAKDLPALRNIVVRFLNSRTLGLLELDPVGEVTFLHRTIPEWLKASKILGQSTLQARMSYLQGLCVIGAHIAPLLEDLSFNLLCLIAHHLVNIVSSYTLSDNDTHGIVKWLQELEQSGVPLDLRWLKDSGIIHHYASTFGIVDLAALCGFVPFVQGRLESNRRLPRNYLFESCVGMEDYSRLASQDRRRTRESFERQWDLLRLCLKHGVTPYEYDESRRKVKECSLKATAQKFRRLADDPKSFHSADLKNKEVSEYCDRVAAIIESSLNAERPLLSRFKEKVLTSFEDYKEKRVKRQRWKLATHQRNQ